MLVELVQAPAVEVAEEAAEVLLALTESRKLVATVAQEKMFLFGLVNLLALLTEVVAVVVVVETFLLVLVLVELVAVVLAHMVALLRLAQRTQVVAAVAADVTVLAHNLQTLADLALFMSVSGTTLRSNHVAVFRST